MENKQWKTETELDEIRSKIVKITRASKKNHIIAELTYSKSTPDTAMATRSGSKLATLRTLTSVKPENTCFLTMPKPEESVQRDQE